MAQHSVKLTEDCRYCAGKEYPETIEFSCGWCGRKKVFRLVEEEKETAAVPFTEVAAVPVSIAGGQDTPILYHQSHKNTNS